MQSGLSQRELEVLTWATKGFTDDMIAKELGIERGTVNSYWVRIRGKLGHLSRSELVARFVQSNADAQHKLVLDETQAAAEDAAATNKDLLDRANAEIERLREMLDKQAKRGPMD